MDSKPLQKKLKLFTCMEEEGIFAKLTINCISLFGMTTPQAQSKFSVHAKVFTPVPEADKENVRPRIN